MRVVLVHSIPATGGGALVIFNDTVSILQAKGVDVVPITRNMSELGTSFVNHFSTFMLNTFPTPTGYIQAKNIISLKPDVVNIFNLYPMYSAWLIEACRKAGIPVVLSFHNYQLTCPICLHLNNGNICDLCKYGNEYWCVLKNCRNNISQSIAYALRNFIVKKFGILNKKVTFYIAPNPFVKRWFMEAGLSADKIEVVPNMVNLPELPVDDPSSGKYIAFAGRFSVEKGIDTLLAASVLEPQLPMRLAGDWEAMPDLKKKANKNVSFLGLLDRTEVAGFYRNARVVVLPTKCFELCPLTILEAMGYGIPVIASRIGGIPEIIDEGVNGLLFEPGNSQDLAIKMKLLWDNPELCREMGRAGREKAIKEYTGEVYYQRLMEVYTKAISWNNNSMSLS